MPRKMQRIVKFGLGEVLRDASEGSQRNEQTLEQITANHAFTVS